MLSMAETPVTVVLLVLNIGASAYALFGEPGLMDRLALRPQRIFETGEWQRFITAGFVHVGMGHLAVNMITLYFFGPLLERILGFGSYLVLYFGSMIAAHALSYVTHRDDPYYSAVGASGAISGIVFAFCLFFPFQKLYLMFAIPIPAILFAVGYVAGSIYAMRESQQDRLTGSGGGGGIAHEAHLGGALAGVLLTIILEPRSLQAFVDALGF